MTVRQLGCLHGGMLFAYGASPSRAYWPFKRTSSFRIAGRFAHLTLLAGLRLRLGRATMSKPSSNFDISLNSLPRHEQSNVFELEHAESIVTWDLHRHTRLLTAVCHKLSMSQGSAEHNADTLQMDGSCEIGHKARCSQIISCFF